MTFALKTAAVAAAVILSASAAQAATVNIGGTGLFDSSTPTTAESAPGQTFTFSFIIQDPISGNPDVSLINPSYTLAGVSILPTITAVTFNNGDNLGLFDLTFSDDKVVSFYGADINADGYLQSGFYQASVALQGGRPIGSGGVSVSVSVSPVPLPASAPLFGGALLALAVGGAAVRRRQRAVTAA